MTSCLTGNFDLYCIIVELVAGNLITALFLILLAIFLIGAISRTNIQTIFALMGMFTLVYMTMWFGGVWAMLIFTLSILWVWFSYNYFLRSRSAG